MLTVAFGAAPAPLAPAGGAICSTPFAPSPLIPTPYQLRMMSPSPTVSPPAMVMVVCFVADPSPGVNVRVYLPDDVPAFVMRTSDCHCELMPPGWPTEGTMSALAGTPPFVVGDTGVTRLTDTGVDEVVEPFVT